MARLHALMARHLFLRSLWVETGAAISSCLCLIKIRSSSG